MSALADIHLVKWIAPGKVALTYNGARAVWVEVTLRKPRTCALTGEPLRSGAKAYKPVGNPSYRVERIAASAIRRLLESVRQV